MAISVIRQPVAFEPPYERCCFCRRPTPFWSAPKDVAVCLVCAGTRSENDVPSKREWFDKETALDRLFPTPSLALPASAIEGGTEP